jgi:SPP1 family predicted phage head-tail adaptor
MKAGTLRNRVTLQQQINTQNAIGELTQQWLDVATVSASVLDVNGREYVTANAIENPVDCKITIRHRKGVVPAMRVVRGTDTYNIQAVLNPSGKRDYLVLMCLKLA